MAERHHGADQHDAVDEVGTRHQRGVQDHRHARDDLVAGEGGQHEDVQREQAIHGFSPYRSENLLDPGVANFARVGQAGAGMTSSSQSSASAPSLMKGEMKLNRFLAYISEACTGMRLGMLVGPMDEHVVGDPHLLAGHRAFDVAAGLGRHVDDDRARLHARDHVGGDDARRLLARDGGGGDERVALATALAEALGLLGLLLVGELARVAAGAAADTPVSTNLAPSDSICSRVSGRTS
jgi:hypothetical protein